MQEKPRPSPVNSKTYGTVSADRQQEMTGLEFVQGLVDGTLPLNTMAETLGYDVTEVVSGRVVVTITPNGTHLNPTGTVHGGLAATLLDSCMGLAIRSTRKERQSSRLLSHASRYQREPRFTTACGSASSVPWRRRMTCRSAI